MTGALRTGPAKGGDFGRTGGSRTPVFAGDADDVERGVTMEFDRAARNDWPREAAIDD